MKEVNKRVSGLSISSLKAKAVSKRELMEIELMDLIDNMHKKVKGVMIPNYLVWVLYLERMGLKRFETDKLMHIEDGYKPEITTINEFKEMVLENIQTSRVKDKLKIADMVIEHSGKLFSKEVLGFLSEYMEPKTLSI